jgi:hypothetical protein
MKKRVVQTSLLILVTFALGIPAIAGSNTANEPQADMVKWGSYLNQHSGGGAVPMKRNAAAKNKTDIVWKGEQAVITRDALKQATYYYQLMGEDDAQAAESALEYLMEHEALYCEASKKGYQATDQEAKEMVDKIRTAYQDGSMGEESKKQLQAVISQFDSEDAYWEYELQVYKKDLPIMNMNNDNEAAYYKDHPGATPQDYQKWFADYKKELVKAENFKKA